MESVPNIQKQYSKQLALVCIPIIMFAAGLVDHGDIVTPPTPKTDLALLFSAVTNIFVCIMTFKWYSQDAVEKSFKRTRVWDWVIILPTVLIALPWYLFKTRGKKKGAISFILLALFSIFWLCVPYVTGLFLPDAFAL